MYSNGHHLSGMAVSVWFFRGREFLGLFCQRGDTRSATRTRKLRFSSQFFLFRLAFDCLDFLFAADGLCFGLVQCLAQRRLHVVRFRHGDDVLQTRCDGDFSKLTVFFCRQYDVGASCFSKDFCDARDGFISNCAKSGGDGHLPASVLNLHGESSIPKDFNAGGGLAFPAGSLILQQLSTRRWCVLGILMSSRYLAIVRRVTWKPCDWRMVAI